MKRRETEGAYSPVEFCGEIVEERALVEGTGLIGSSSLITSSEEEKKHTKTSVINIDLLCLGLPARAASLFETFQEIPVARM